MDINEFVNNVATNPIAQVAVIMGIAEVVKRQEIFENKFIFVLDLVLGLLMGVGVYILSMGYPVYEGILAGLGLGLSACGLFSGVKNMRESYDSPEILEDKEDE